MDRASRELLVKRLRELQTHPTGGEASGVVAVDGLIIASSRPAGVEEDRVSAMSAAMLSLGERIAGELGRGGLDEVYIHGGDGYVLLMAAGTDAVLTVLAREQTEVGAGLLGMRRGGE